MATSTMSSPPPTPPKFDLLRAAFLLIAGVVIAELSITMVGMLSCFWLILSGRYELDACASATEQARAVFTELLTAVLALLLAGRTPPAE
jgi:hypothetical protein